MSFNRLIACLEELVSNDDSVQPLSQELKDLDYSLCRQKDPKPVVESFMRKLDARRPEKGSRMEWAVTYSRICNTCSTAALAKKKPSKRRGDFTLICIPCGKSDILIGP